MAGSKSEKNTIFIVGQRYISEMEPELGLGTVLQVDHRRVTIAFHDGKTVRIYTKENAPLRRIKFKAGDSIQVVGSESLTVESVEERDSLVYYHTGKGVICEIKLSSANKITAPIDRLLSSNVDSINDYNLRADILDLRYKIADSPVRGYVGGRIDLIPHQIYIANEVSSRFVRRIMLADEVGLGKTIEACLILHRLIVSGRVSQVLIIVPESMVHVWFVELLRKFNLLFSIVENTEEELEVNPFSSSSQLLIGMNYLSSSKQLIDKASEIDWDMVIIDEAHHLVQGSEEFSAVEKISQRAKDLLLLTATPQHFGEQNHFARLRLLDPSRYSSFEEHCHEADEHRKIAEITGKILDGIDLEEKDIQRMQGLLHSQNIVSLLSSVRNTALSDSDRKQIVAEIIDRQGIGRALFRNTRTVIGGFPKRNVSVELMKSTAAQKENVITIFNEDFTKRSPVKKRTFTNDPRVEYLAELLKRTNEDKVLVICRSKFTVVALDEALQKQINVKTALFHEDLTLLQRDRNAAWFSEDEGARILICSEIGSEGRNFQFAHHLFLFDLPANPELVEQRIGRLDRIGQKHTIELYVPVLSATPEAFLAKWYNDGLGIFNQTVPAAQETYERFSSELNTILFYSEFISEKVIVQIANLISKTKDAVTEISLRLKSGRDRLLEQHSFRPKEALELVSMIRTFDEDRSLKEIMKRLLKSRGILAEEFQEDTWNLLSESQLDESFPGLSASRSIVTFNRSKSLHREDYEFLTIDHPAVTGGIDIFISSDTGNACLALQKQSKTPQLLLETIFTAECIAPPSLFISRFLAPVVMKIVVDSKGTDLSASLSGDFFTTLEHVKTFPFIDKVEFKQQLFPSMIKRAESIALKKCEAIIKESSLKIENTAGSEVKRLRSLKQINPSISEHEIAMAEREYSELLETVIKTSPRLEAVRLIWCPGRK